MDKRTAIAELRSRFCGEQCKEECSCYDCPFNRVLEPGFVDMVDALKDWLTHYPETVFPRHLGGMRDVGPIFIDMLRDAVDFIDRHPSGQAEQPPELAKVEEQARVYRVLSEWLENRKAPETLSFRAEIGYEMALDDIRVVIADDIIAHAKRGAERG